MTKPSTLTVSELNRAVAGLLERSFPLVWVRGELSNLTRAASGHWYFTLKDAGASVRAVMFRSRAAAVDFAPREGMQLEVRALVSFYEARGEFQLNVEAMRQAGAGVLYEAFLRLKAKLESAGLLDATRKRALPAYPERIGLVTSPKAAALSDVLTTLKRRAPHVAIVLYPSAVQGEGAAAALAQAVRTASARAETDVLILCRGGGSIEDLWAFNDEALAMAIAECSIPVVSGVGHETDFTIADFVADVRAPTPTAAAELVAPSGAALRDMLGKLAGVLGERVARRLDSSRQRLDLAMRLLVSPTERLERGRQRLARAASGLAHAGTDALRTAQERMLRLAMALRDRRPRLDSGFARVRGVARALAQAQSELLARQGALLDARAAQLRSVDPQRVLERGFSLVRTGSGAIVRDSARLAVGERISLTFAQGEAHARVDEVAAAKGQPLGDQAGGKTGAEPNFR